MATIDSGVDDEESGSLHEICEVERSEDPSSSDDSDFESDDADADEVYAIEEEEERRVPKRMRRGNDGASSEDEDEQENIGEEGLNYKIVKLLQRGRNLNALKIDECKAYLREHGLRLTGPKSVCIQRILEHWRLKDGAGEKLYPRSSFFIDCTGDVCTGDFILFKQRVYDKYDKVTRGGNIIGKRTIAGKVVKESYGAAKAQHTFTVEVLWSKGVKPLPSLYPLLVKGRNLYRLKTFRQRWGDEKERSKVLAEKHRRGATARHARANEKAKSVVRGQKCHWDSHDRRKQPAKKRKDPKQKTIMEANKKRQPFGFNIVKLGKLEPATGHNSVSAHPSLIQRNTFLHHRRPPNIHGHPMIESHFQGSGSAFSANKESLYFSTYEAGFSTTVGTGVYNQALNRQNFISHSNSAHYLQHSSTHLSPSSNIAHTHLSPSSFNFPPLVPLNRWEAGVLHCQTPGCMDIASKGCASSCCWMCCRRSGRRCNWHA